MPSDEHASSWPSMGRNSSGPQQILIAGGTKGIGLAIAKRLAGPGVTFFLNYAASDAAAHEARQLVEALGAKVHLIKQDIATREGSAEVIRQVAEQTEGLDLLVHCAAIPNPAALIEQDLAVVHETIAIGGLSLLYLVQPAIPLLRSGSNVLFLSGKVVDVTLHHFGALASAKALGECMVRYLAVELAPRGINVNTLRTGPVDTELSRKVRAAMPNPEDRKPATTPNGRALQLEEIAEVAAFLASPAADMIRGQAIAIDGGLCIMSR